MEPWVQQIAVPLAVAVLTSSGLWAAGGTVVLQYLPHELVGHYFVEVS